MKGISQTSSSMIITNHNQSISNKNRRLEVPKKLIGMKQKKKR